MFAFFFLNNSFFILDEAEEEIEIETIAIHRFNIDNMMKSSTRNLFRPLPTTFQDGIKFSIQSRFLLHKGILFNPTKLKQLENNLRSKRYARTFILDSSHCKQLT